MENPVFAQSVLHIPPLNSTVFRVISDLSSDATYIRDTSLILLKCVFIKHIIAAVTKRGFNVAGKSNGKRNLNATM